jgi:hypothetical protein
MIPTVVTTLSIAAQRSRRVAKFRISAKPLASGRRSPADLAK